MPFPDHRQAPNVEPPSPRYPAGNGWQIRRQETKWYWLCLLRTGDFTERYAGKLFAETAEYALFGIFTLHNVRLHIGVSRAGRHHITAHPQLHNSSPTVSAGLSAPL